MQKSGERKICPTLYTFRNSLSPCHRRPRSLAPLAPVLRPPVAPGTPVTLALLVARDNARIARELRAARMGVQGSGYTATRNGTNSPNTPSPEQQDGTKMIFRLNDTNSTPKPHGASNLVTGPARELVAEAATRVLAALGGVLGQGEGWGDW